MNRNFKKGFTLIELLVVIAIIGILSAVVLASLNSARNKGADAAVRSNLNNVRAQAELYYDIGNTYASACTTDTNIARALAAAASAGYPSGVSGCNDAATSWIMYAELRTSDHATGGTVKDVYCVDSKGDARDLDYTQQPGGAADGTDATTCVITD